MQHDADLRVLLVSPLRGVDPSSGDVTYTEQLLAAPPPGVRYTTYIEAIERGDLIEVGTRRALAGAPWKLKPTHLAVSLWRRGETLIRKTGFVYRERLRHFIVRPGAYDLVHVHVFHTRFYGSVPVVISAGGPLRVVYRTAWGWSPRRTAFADQFDKFVGSVWNASMFGIRPGRAARFVTLSEDFRTHLVDAGWPESKIDVCPNYLSLPAGELRADRTPRMLGFIAKDFEAKGGLIALAAFRELRKNYPHLRLTVVGSSHPASSSDDVEWRTELPREELLHHVLPTIDILLYPTFFDTSVPYVPTEAISLGIPCVVSDYGALPELVQGGGGRVSRAGDVDSVVRATEELLDQATWDEASAAARRRFDRRFSAETQAPLLREAYSSALQGVGREGENGLRWSHDVPT